ncbi:hypothetical protein HDU89_000354 [Geranomyces variabilis]|nr:hypothetical protein HDU89_000354 [Geranomyces variabilis]
MTNRQFKLLLAQARSGIFNPTNFARSQKFQSEGTCRARMDIKLRELRTLYPTLAPTIDAALRYVYEDDPRWLLAEDDPADAASEDKDEPLGRPVPAAAAFENKNVVEIQDEEAPLRKRRPAPAAFEKTVNFQDEEQLPQSRPRTTKSAGPAAAAFEDASLRTPARKAPTTLLGHVRTPFLIASASPAHAAPKHPFKARYGASETIKQQARHRLSLAQWFIADPAIAAIPQVTSGALTYREVLARTRLPVISASVVSQLNDPERAWAIPALAAQRSVCLSRAWWPFDPSVTLPLGLVTGIVTLLTLDTASADLDTAEDDERSLAINLLKLISRTSPMVTGKYRKSDTIASSMVSPDPTSTLQPAPAFAAVIVSPCLSRYPGVAGVHPPPSRLRRQDALAAGFWSVSAVRGLAGGVPSPRMRYNGVFWVLDANGPSFDLRFGPEGNAARLVSALRMAQYFRDVVIPDAEALLSQLLVPLGETPEHTLPALPHDPPTSRQCGQFTPVGKRNVPAHAEPAE